VTALLLDHLWQSSLCVGAAGLLALAFRRNGAHIRYWLWFAASVKFLLPFAALTALGAYLLTPVARPVPAAAATLTFVEPLAKPFSAPTTALTGTQFIALPALSPTRTQPRPVPHAAPMTSPHPSLQSWLLALWAAGFSVFVLRWLVLWSRVHHLLADAVAMRIDAPIPVKCLPSRLEPGLVGILRPVILLPMGIEQQLSPAELAAVLAHELCHWRRRDNLLAAIHMLVEALFWFFPLVWWLGVRLNTERECACDESVLAQGNDPQLYAEGILKVCRAYLQSPLACVAGVSGADLKQRIEAIMENRLVLQLNAARKCVLSVAAALALALPLALGLMATPAFKAPAKAAPLLAANTKREAGPAALFPPALPAENQSAKNPIAKPLARQTPPETGPRVAPSHDETSAPQAAVPIDPPSLQQALAALSSEPASLPGPNSAPLPTLATHAPAPSRTCALPAVADQVSLRKISGSELMTVPVRINGVEKQFLLDFDTDPTEISAPAVAELHLPHVNRMLASQVLDGPIASQAPFFDVKGAGTPNDYRGRVGIAAFTMGDATLHDMQFLIANDRDMGNSAPYDGRLTRANFPQYDIDLDFGGRQLSFLTPTSCADPDQVAYWPHQAVAVVPLTLADGKMQVQVTIAGHVIDAVIDTASPRTIMRRDIAELLLGLKSSDMPQAGDLTDGYGMQIYTHTFPQISFPGGVTANNVPALIQANSMVHKLDRSPVLGSRATFARDPGERIPDLALGMDVLHQLHLYAAFEQSKLYVTPAENKPTLLSAD